MLNTLRCAICSYFAFVTANTRLGYLARDSTFLSALKRLRMMGQGYAETSRENTLSSVTIMHVGHAISLNVRIVLFITSALAKSLP